MANGRAGRPHKDLFGLRFGHLLPLKYERDAETGRSYWICACAGGGGIGPSLCISKRAVKTIRVPQQYLMTGGKRSCGCASLIKNRGPNAVERMVEATLADYMKAGVAVDVPLKYGRTIPVAAPTTTPPKGEVLNGYIVEDKDGVKWYADANDAIDADAKFDYDTPEYWQALNAAIDKAGRVRATN